MLVLSRMEAERVRIDVPGLDGPIWLIVAEVNRGKLRLGIDAPASVKIYREELLPAERQYNRHVRGEDHAKTAGQAEAQEG